MLIVLNLSYEQVYIDYEQLFLVIFREQFVHKLCPKRKISAHNSLRVPQEQSGSNLRKNYFKGFVKMICYIGWEYSKLSQIRTTLFHGWF